MDIYFATSWYDTRLQYKSLNPGEYIPISHKMMEKFWIPDIFFTNAIASNYHNTLLPNRLMKVLPDGKVIFNVR